MTSETACASNDACGKNYKEEFYETKVKKLEERQRTMEKSVNDAESALESAKKCLEKWEECLKKREETKKLVEKEKNSAFIPCFAAKKVQEFHNCVKCCRKTHACILQRKQEVILAGIREKLVRKQLALVNDDLKQAKDFLDKIEKICKKNELLSVKVEESRLSIIATDLLKRISEETYKETLEKYKDAGNSIVLSDGSKIFADSDEENSFLQAKKRMHSDFCISRERKLFDESCINFIRLAMNRGDILRDYNQKANCLLSCFKQKNSSGNSCGNNLEEYKFLFEERLKEYEECVSSAQGDYKKVKDIFSQIAKSPELTCYEKKCISIEADECRSNSLKAEKECHDEWIKVNKGKIKLQVELLKEVSEKETSCCADESGQLCNMKHLLADLKEAERKYCGSLAECLDSWEASIPDHIWENISKYEEAYYLLNKIASIKGKKDAMEQSLYYWVNAFKEEDNHKHCDDFMKHAHDILKEQVEYAVKNNAEILQAAIRGEENTFIVRELYGIISRVIPTADKNLSAVNPYNLPFKFSIIDDTLSCIIDSCTQSFLPSCRRGDDRECLCFENPDCGAKIGAEETADSPAQQQVRQCVATSSAQQSSQCCDYE